MPNFINMQRMPSIYLKTLYNTYMFPQDKPLPAPHSLVSGVTFTASTDFSPVFGYRWLITNQNGQLVSVTSCRGNFNRAWNTLTNA